MGNLIITRRELETVFIGEVAVTVVSVDRGRLRLSIQAPLEVEISRKEILPASDPRSRYVPFQPKE